MLINAVFRAGYLFGILMLQRELRVEVLPSHLVHAVCSAAVESGRRLRRQVELPGDLPLLYEYHSKAYLGIEAVFFVYGMCGCIVYAAHFFHKRNVYKHTEPDFWQKFKHMISITPALNLPLPYQQKNCFEFNKSDCNLTSFVKLIDKDTNLLLMHCSIFSLNFRSNKL